MIQYDMINCISPVLTLYVFFLGYSGFDKKRDG